MLTCRPRTDVDNVEPIDARSMLDAAASVAATMEAAAGQPRVERRRRLPPAALAVANQKVRKAYSPIVIAGGVRIADFALISSIGISINFVYVAPISGFHWEYITAIFGIAAIATLLSPPKIVVPSETI